MIQAEILADAINSSGTERRTSLVLQSGTAYPDALRRGSRAVRVIVAHQRARVGGPIIRDRQRTVRSHNIQIEVNQAFAVTLAVPAPMPCAVWQAEQLKPSLM